MGKDWGKEISDVGWRIADGGEKSISDVGWRMSNFWNWRNVEC